MSPFKLEDHPKIATGFSTPENYFEQLSSKVVERLEDQKEIQVISLYQARRNWLMVAAAVLVAALMVPIYNATQVTAAPDAASIENYITYQAGLSQYELIELLETEDIQQLDEQLAIENIEDGTIEEILTSNTNFENYITE